MEAGEPTPTMGSYLRVMGVLGVSQDLALLANETPPAKRAEGKRQERKREAVK